MCAVGLLAMFLHACHVMCMRIFVFWLSSFLADGHTHTKLVATIKGGKGSDHFPPESHPASPRFTVIQKISLTPAGGLPRSISDWGGEPKSNFFSRESSLSPWYSIDSSIAPFFLVPLSLWREDQTTGIGGGSASPCLLSSR